MTLYVVWLVCNVVPLSSAVENFHNRMKASCDDEASFKSASLRAKSKPLTQSLWPVSVIPTTNSWFSSVYTFIFELSSATARIKLESGNLAILRAVLMW